MSEVRVRYSLHSGFSRDYSYRSRLAWVGIKMKSSYSRKIYFGVSRISTEKYQKYYGKN